METRKKAQDMIRELPLQLYLNGTWSEPIPVAPDNQRTRTVTDPYNQQVITNVAEAGSADAERAIAAARRAFDESEWSNLSGAERGRILFRIAQEIERHAETLACLETLNTGKTLAESRTDMVDVVNVFRYFAGLADKSRGEVIDSPIPHASSQMIKEPIGVCALITPWNYPLLQASWKIAPALAVGCTMILKPSELTPLTTLKLAEIIDRVGLPNGVFNVVTGAGSTVGHTLSASPLVDFVSFTGGALTGRRIMRAASGNFKRVALELGGKNPNIVFADANFDVAVDYALNAAFFHAGQVCSAGSRLLVQAEIHDRFIEALLARVQRIQLGDGFNPDTEMGPLISRNHRAKVEAFIASGCAEGAKLVCGGGRPDNERTREGFFLKPTVLSECHAGMRIVQEEIFGPVLTVETFLTEAEVIASANNTAYGLAGAVWTSDMNVAQRVSKALRMGTVWINDFHPYFPQAPWGGYKQSGIGRELGHIGLEEFLEHKHVFQNLRPQAQNWFGRG